MSDRVFANGRSVACKSSSGKSVCAFPDVCLTPPAPPAGPLPIPYANTGYASDIAEGSKDVTVNGKEILLRDVSYFEKTTGNEAATRSQGMNVVTHTIQGKVFFLSWSMDVVVENKNVVRHLDFCTHNHNPQPGGTPGWPYFGGQAVEIPDHVCADLENEIDQAEAAMPNWAKKGAYTVDSALFVRGDTGQGSILWATSRTLRPESKYFNNPKFPFVKGLGGEGSRTNTASNIPNHSYRLNPSAPKCSHAEARILEVVFREFNPMPQGSRAVIKIRWRNAQGVLDEPCADCRKAIENAKKAGLQITLCQG